MGSREVRENQCRLWNGQPVGTTLCIFPTAFQPVLEPSQLFVKWVLPGQGVKVGTHPLPGDTKEGCQESFAKQFLIASNFLYNYFYILVGYIVVINT